MAFATLVTRAVPVRLTGQDTIRGTFSQRHVALYDAHTGARFVPLEQVAAEHRASFNVFNSPLSENAAVAQIALRIMLPPALSSSLRGAKRRSNPCFRCRTMDCFASLAMTDQSLA